MLPMDGICWNHKRIAKSQGKEGHWAPIICSMKIFLHAFKADAKEWQSCFDTGAIELAYPDAYPEQAANMPIDRFFRTTNVCCENTLQQR